VIDITEPRSELEHETLDPLFLSSENGNMLMYLNETLLVFEAAQVVVAFIDAGHGRLVATDPAWNADAAKRPIIPV